MLLFAHHVAVELFGREFSPRTPFEHACAFAAVGTVLALAVYGAWTLAGKIWARSAGRHRLG
jgi:hypothetical protein